MSKTKYLWTTALVALCVVVASGLAFAQASWDATADDGFPSAMVWDATADVTIDADNDGSVGWDTAYSLWSVEGALTSAAAIDRWGLDEAPAGGFSPTVAPAASTTVEFTITAPPMTSPTAGFECDWQLHNGGYVTTDIVEKDIVVSRFPDDQPSSLGGWARGSIEACAGRAPMIVQGYPDGTYGPRVTVSRDQMAVFIYRAAKVAAVTPGTATFDDVDTGHWAFTPIESLVDAGIVNGYDYDGDGTPDHYDPAGAVTRAQMARFICNSTGYTMTTPATPSFTDVPATYWTYSDIETCKLEGVVGGYPDGTYGPTVTVSRDQMAVFVDRAFIQSTGAAVVMGGPGLTSFDPSGAGWDGFTSTDVDPGYAYIAFDTAALDTNLCFGGTWDITFDFREGTGTTVASSTTVNVAAGTITGASGTYFVVSTAVPGGLAAGDYNLAVSVEDETGAMNERSRKPTFSVS